jgi:hypothetical protein
MKMSKVQIVAHQIDKHFPAPRVFGPQHVLEKWDYGDWKPNDLMHCSQFVRNLWQKGEISIDTPGAHHTPSTYTNVPCEPGELSGSLKGRKTASGFKLLKPAPKDVLKADYDFNTIGQAIVFIMKKQKDQIEELKRQAFEQKEQLRDVRRANREMEKQLEKERAEVSEIREGIRQQQGKFSFSEMLSDEETKQLLVES